jgi:hypothetical protein
MNTLPHTESAIMHHETARLIHPLYGLILRLILEILKELPLTPTNHSTRENSDGPLYWCDRAGLSRRMYLRAQLMSESARQVLMGLLLQHARCTPGRLCPRHPLRSGFRRA